MVSVLLSASVERFFVSRMLDFVWPAAQINDQDKDEEDNEDNEDNDNYNVNNNNKDNHQKGKVNKEETIVSVLLSASLKRLSFLPYA